MSMALVQSLPWIFLAVGSVIVLGGGAAIFKVDTRWRRAHLQCCRCLATWRGRNKLCTLCGARGQTYDWLAEKYAGFPTHDWQGYLDTGPIKVVRVPPEPQMINLTITMKEES